MFYEKRVRSLQALMEELRRLDSDAGVRLAGSYGERPCFAFVTRFAEKYTVMVCERRGVRAPTAGALLVAKEFDALGELEAFLSPIARKRLDAYVY